MTRPRKNPGVSGILPRIFCSRGGRLTTSPTRRCINEESTPSTPSSSLPLYQWGNYPVHPVLLTTPVSMGKVPRPPRPPHYPCINGESTPSTPSSSLPLYQLGKHPVHPVLLTTPVSMGKVPRQHPPHYPCVNVESTPSTPSS